MLVMLKNREGCISKLFPLRFKSISCLVAEGTLKFWLGKNSPISEYKIIGGKYLKAEIEDCSYVVCTFVRGTGNSREYEERQK